MNKGRSGEYEAVRPLDPEGKPNLLATILGTVADAVLVTEACPIDEPGPKVVYANESFTRMTGYTLEDIVGETPRILQGPQTDRDRLDEIRTALTERKPVRVELLNYRKDGTEFWVEVDIEPATDEHGNHTHWVSVQRDITERRCQQEALEESEKRLRTILVQYASDMITILAPDGIIRYESPAVERVLGYKSEELIGHSVVDYVHPEDVERTVIELGGIRDEHGARGPVEFRFRHKDGSWRCLEAIGNNLIDDPAVGGVVINSRDVTGRKDAEEKLKEAEERYRALVENVPAVVYIDDVDETNSVLYRSPFVREVLGYEPEEFLADPYFWQNLLHSEDRERVLVENERTNETCEPFRIEYRMIHKDGRTVWIRDEAVLIRDEEGNPKFWQGYFVDVTERKAVEERLKEAEARYRTLVEEVPAMTYTSSQKPGEPSAISYMSPQVEAILGYSPEKYVNDPQFWATIIHPEDRDRILDEDVRTGKTGDVFREEFRMIARDGRTVWMREDGRLARVEEDGTEIWHGVMFDITEIKRTETRLRESEGRYRILVEQVPAAIYIREPILVQRASYKVSYMSARIEEILGYPAQSFMEDQNLWNEVIHPDDLDRVVAEDERTAESGDPFSMEYRVLHRDGREVWIRDEAELIRDPEGEPLYWQGVLIDTTERKLQQDAIRESEERYRSVAESVREIIFQTDAEGHYVFLNPAWEEITGFGVEEGLGKSYLEFIHPDDLQRNLEDLEKMGSHGGDYAEYEVKFLAKDGSPLDIEIKSKEHFDEQGNLVGTSGTLNDITERKNAESKLQESEQRFRQLFEQSVDAMYVHDQDGRFVDCNTQACNLLGYTREELLSMSVADISCNVLTEEEQARQEEEGGTLWQRALAAEPGVFSQGHEEENIRKDGTTFPVEVRVGSVDYDGRRMMLVSVRDITERKRTEEALRRSEEQFRSAFEGASTGVALVSLEDRPFKVNRALCEMLGYREEEILGRHSSEFTHPDDVEATDDRSELLLTNDGPDNMSMEKRYICADGRVVWAISDVSLVRDSEGEPSHLICQFQDITKRKQAEESLLESETRYRAVVERTEDGIFLGDFETSCVLEANAALGHMLGYTVEELQGMSLSDFIVDDPKAIDRNTHLIREHGNHFLGERRYRRKDGTLIDVETSATTIPYGGKEASCCIARDITERKTAERALLESEERFRGAFENASTGVALVSLDNHYLRVNRTLCEMLGYPEEELVGMRSFDITHPEDQVKSRGRARRVLEDDGPKTMRIEKRYLRKDGGVAWAISDVSLVRDAEGNPSHFVSHFQDITERKSLEDQLSYQALHDSLTGLPNRSSLRGRFSRVAGSPTDRMGDRAKSLPGGGRYVAVLFLDLDGFKEVNDSLGHAAGDELLQAVAERLRNVVRPQDTVSRLGGDEFCVLLAGVSGSAEAVRVAERVKVSIEAPFSITSTADSDSSPENASMTSLSTSIGIAVSEPGRAGGSLDELLREADAAMYRAKKRGGALYEIVELTEDAG